MIIELASVLEDWLCLSLHACDKFRLRAATARAVIVGRLELTRQDLRCPTEVILLFRRGRQVHHQMINWLRRVADSTVALAVDLASRPRADQILQLLILIVASDKSMVGGGGLRLILDRVEA